MEVGQACNLILDAFKKMCGPEWDQKGALEDLNSENPSEGAKAFREIVQLLNSHLQVKSPYHRALESIYIVSSQNYLDEASRKSALLHIQSLIQQTISQPKDSSLKEENAAKIKMAFALGDGAEFAQGFITHIGSFQFSLTKYSCQEIQNILASLNGVYAPDLHPKFAKIANILKTVFPSPEVTKTPQFLSQEDISKIKMAFNMEDGSHFCDKFIDHMEKSGGVSGSMAHYSRADFYHALLYLFSASYPEQIRKFSKIADILESIFSPSEVTKTPPFLSQEDIIKIRKVFALENAVRFCEPFIQHLRDVGEVLSKYSNIDYYNALLHLFGSFDRELSGKFVKVADHLALILSK